MVAAISDQARVPSQAVREAAHIVGSEENWLARIEARQPKVAIWPRVEVGGLGAMTKEVHAGCRRYLDRLQEPELNTHVTYTNSAGAEFTNTVGEMLWHVALHGQYHRGKINLLLRQASLEPAPVDYIAWVRGAPAATEADAGTSEGGTR
jgi:uncharacterized damage-inducible protein DinB